MRILEQIEEALLVHYNANVPIQTILVTQEVHDEILNEIIFVTGEADINLKYFMFGGGTLIEIVVDHDLITDYKLVLPKNMNN